VRLHPAIRALLWPASLVYGAIVRLRAWLYRVGIFKAKRLDGVVISVGNLTVGGTGKTPFVLWLAQHLSARGERVGILTRGYRGAVGDSDEVRLLRSRLGEKVQFGVGADRYAHGSLLTETGVHCFLLDDGFQHLRLARDVDIVLIDATDPFGEGHLLPAGRLREPKSALRRADIIVITRTDRAPAVEAAVRRYSSAPILYARAVLQEVRPGAHSLAEAAPAGWQGKKAFAFCAVGNSAAFFDDLPQWGIAVVGCAAFPDHYSYTPRDVAEIERGALGCGAEVLVATEKDAYNLGRLMFQSLPLYHCHITMRVTEPEKFWQALDAALERKRSGEAR
jgi:tetraacyldisaccharide 4'-kinase